MPYVPDASLTIPPDETVIWRFMTIPRLVSLIYLEALWFSRLDKLGDEWEGMYIHPELAKLARSASAEVERRETTTAESTSSIANYYSTLRSMVEGQRLAFAANCWYVSDHESMLMWKAYAPEHVAIRSTVGRLKASINELDQIRIGQVIYASAPEQPIGIQPMFLKRPAFGSENELRLMFNGVVSPMTAPTIARHHERTLELHVNAGFHCMVDVPTLIEAVVSSPLLPLWAHEAVEMMVHALNDALNVERSALAAPPPRLPDIPITLRPSAKP